MLRPRAAAILTSICLALGAAAATADRATLDAANIAWEEGDSGRTDGLPGDHRRSARRGRPRRDRAADGRAVRHHRADAGWRRAAVRTGRTVSHLRNRAWRRAKAPRRARRAPGQTIAELPGHGPCSLTYDARYYRSTDAHPFVEAYGDIAGGFGAYSVLASPHYHRRHDVLEHVDHRLVAETAKATLATVVQLASSPSPVRGLEVATDASGLTTVTWEKSPETDVDGYVVSWTPAGGATGAQTLRVTAPAATFRAPRGAAIAVRAVNERGLESWDARSHEGTK